MNCSLLKIKCYLSIIECCYHFFLILQHFYIINCATANRLLAMHVWSNSHRKYVKNALKCF